MGSSVLAEGAACAQALSPGQDRREVLWLPGFLLVPLPPLTRSVEGPCCLSCQAEHLTPQHWQLPKLFSETVPGLWSQSSG